MSETNCIPLVCACGTILGRSTLWTTVISSPSNVHMRASEPRTCGALRARKERKEPVRNQMSERRISPWSAGTEKMERQCHVGKLGRGRCRAPDNAAAGEVKFGAQCWGWGWGYKYNPCSQRAAAGVGSNRNLAKTGQWCWWLCVHVMRCM
ncbi:hypothetical protein TRVL_07632 [Trypanosoma vivax]|nr:hypothetical protein TRVL_07632 [Trypanosoma vivax]